MKYPLDPKVELLKWGPVPACEYYVDIFEGLITGFATAYPGYFWPRPLVLFKDGRMFWAEEEKAVQEMGGRIFMERVFPKKERDEDEVRWRVVRDALARAEEQLEQTELSTLTDKEFRKAWRSFHDEVVDYWSYSTITELANYGSLPILEAQLKPLVQASEIPLVMEVLTAPEQISFYQEEELELAETDDIEAHQKKFFWIANSYANVEIVPLERFRERKASLAPDLREKALARIGEVRKQKNSTKEKYRLPAVAMQISEGICKALSLQDERKKGNWRYMHDCELLLQEAARRYAFDINDGRRMFIREIEGLMDGKKIDMDSRKKGHGFLVEEMTFIPVTVEELNGYWEAYVEVKKQDVSEFRGTIACKGSGPVHGTVRIIQDPRGASTFNKGDILVAEMTTPDYVALMKIAGAIVTDTGGLMSHAAVVSREFNVPCIIGTKIATGALKDGDMVEVDAEKGIVRKI